MSALPAGRVVSAHDLVIGGYEPFSTVDWPGKLVSTVFLQGCPWRCTYCHNPDLQDPQGIAAVTWETVLAHLAERHGQLDGVVFSGGEPTRQDALIPAMIAVREQGLGVGLHTAGCYPVRLATMLRHVDWLGLDIKMTPREYGAVTGIGSSGERAWASLEAALTWGGELEVRLTVDPTVHWREDVLGVLARLAERGAPAPVLQQARATGATPEYAARLGGRGIWDVLRPEDVKGLVIR
jgi:pyruvate formate lyase activating enzyme